ncbi:F-box/kelch-repeat protein At3g23880 [Cajanus cajan]|uniref:F-box/kelch-repeat protein At3g06240 family n=1 Tax=Cajanus cajan TaxID=3821 RepID=A0A151T7F7_CAJCA|nr:F-box/kelch-repeat protein At3g23880 [Cajanus cajan]KYP62955.1 F-box/kelch-repeat protein At3g06240 family [Cajanus cajan]
MALPLEIITEIFLRGPVKSFCRAKAVCKLWFGLFAQSVLAKKHYDLAVDQNRIAKKIMLFSCFVNEILAVDVTKPLVAPDASCILRSPLANSIRYSKIVGTCRGMVLISVPTSMLIWNPSTGFTRSFCPWSATTISICGDVFGLNFYGFSYDRSEDNYVVLQIYLSKHDTSHRALLYSVNDDSWRDIEDDSLSTITRPSVCVHQGSMGLYFADSLHWITFNYETNADVILAYNIFEAKFYELSIPDEVELQDYSVCCLRIIRDSLALCTVMHDENWDYTVDIWEMKEYGVTTSWSKLTCMQVSNHISRYMLPACSSENSLVFVNNESGLFATWNAMDLDNLC